MKKFLSLIRAAVPAALIASAAAVLLSGCGNAAGGTVVPNPDTEYYSQLKDEGITLNFANWGDYISDGTDGYPDVISEFEDLTGITINCTTFATNEDLYAKMKAGAADYDIIIPSDYMISKMISEDMLEKLDRDNIPNIGNTDPKYLSREFDPSNEYSVPYFWGVTGIIYNKELVDEEDFGWEILWDEKYADQILMFDNPRDAFAVAENMLGYSMNSEDPAELQAAADLLTRQKPLVQAYVMDEIFNKMGAGEAAVAPYYAGDAVMLMRDYDFLDFKTVDSGANLFIDSMCIPKHAKNKKAAEIFINYLLEPEAALANSDYVGYSTPNAKAFELVSDDIKNNGISYFSDEYLSAHTETFKTLSPDAERLMSDLWTKIRSGK